MPHRSVPTLLNYVAFGISLQPAKTFCPFLKRKEILYCIVVEASEKVKWIKIMGIMHFMHTIMMYISAIVRGRYGGMIGGI